MPNKQRYSQHQQKTPDDFDLDRYLEEKGSEFAGNYEGFSSEEPKTNRFLNGFLLVIALVVSVIWSYNVTKENSWSGILGLGDATEIPEVSREVTTAPVAPLSDVTENNFDYDGGTELGSVTDYLQQLDQEGLLNDRLINGFEARQLYSNGTPIEYLKALNDAGYLSKFSFVYINEYYNSQIPLEYLTVLDNAGYLDHFSFVSVIELYKNDVSLEYLSQLEEGGYLFDLSFVYITEYYKNGVTVEFLNDLKSKNLYDKLSFVDVVELYKAEGN